jgi:hypothetical protein
LYEVDAVGNVDDLSNLWTMAHSDKPFQTPANPAIVLEEFSNRGDHG